MTTEAQLHHYLRLRASEGAPADPQEACKTTLRLPSREVITQGKNMNRLRNELTDLLELGPELVHHLYSSFYEVFVRSAHLP